MFSISLNCSDDISWDFACPKFLLDLVEFLFVFMSRFSPTPVW